MLAPDTTELPKDKYGRSIPAMRPLASGAHQLTISNISTQQSSAWDQYTKIISIYPTVDCFIEIGANPTASSSTHFIPANTYMFLNIMLNSRDQAAKIAVIRNSTDGTLYISEFQ